MVTKSDVWREGDIQGGGASGRERSRSQASIIPHPAEWPTTGGESLAVVPPLPAARSATGRIGPIYSATKRLLDYLVCLLLAPVVGPVIGLACLLVWLESPGPLLFFQWRTGQGGRRFRMVKIRTMCADAEEQKERFRHLNELTWPDFKISDDPRMTRVGRWLRRTSIDELPQLWNVLVGEMTLVGPRPTSFSAETYEPWQWERLEVLPGITGLWQIRGRSDVDFVDRVRMDIEYVRTCNLWLDLRILFLTIFAVIGRRGAC